MSSSAGKKPRDGQAGDSLHAGIRALPGVGPGRQRLLETLGIETIADLLLYPPRRYVDRKAAARISDLKHGEIRTITGRVDSVQVKRARGRVLVIAGVADASGTVSCVWFNQPYLKNTLRRGGSYVFSGRVRTDRFGTALIQPEFEMSGGKRLHTGRVVAVYSLTRGLGQRQMRRMVNTAFEAHGRSLGDPVPRHIIEGLGLVTLEEALRGLHFPDDLQHARRARRRLAFDELLLFQTLFARARALMRERPPRAAGALGDLAAALDFKLTPSQEAVLSEVRKDLAGVRPMRRLIQGDVGCGKTVIAALAALSVCRSGGQVAFMCPTELLAEQHYATMGDFLNRDDRSVGLLTGSLPSEDQEKVLLGAREGGLDMVVGTHSLFSERVDFQNLRLVIVDEEQRFGVLQRSGLLLKAPDADFLAMSATPIPRTLALTAYGDLDVSVVGELPPGRGRHETWIVPESRRQDVQKEFCGRLTAGERGFYICPAIEDGASGLTGVETARRELTRLLGGSSPVSVITGRTSREDRQKVIEDFRAGDACCIVATSVLEVGVDVPLATLLVVEHADRFGLSQLHQMRGRVSRSSRDSRSYMIVSESAGAPALRRLSVLEKVYDGFEIAERDLAFRGPGDMVGKRQHGLPGLRFTSLPEDIDLLNAARVEARRHAAAGEDSEWTAWLEVVGRAAGGERMAV
jgi:ATP-dependent DNA helicase RecG